MDESILNPAVESGTEGSQEGSLVQEQTPQVEGQQGNPVTENEAKTGADSQVEQPVFSVNIPEGMQLTQESLAAFEKDVKEVGLTNEQAQKFLDISHRNQVAAMEAHKAQVTRWAEEVRMDKDMGGGMYEDTIRYSNAALCKFDEGGELFAILKSTGYSNHPVIVRALSNLGRAHAEDKLITGDKVQVKQSRDEALYGHYNKKYGG